jgi:hypothetical protein
MNKKIVLAINYVISAAMLYLLFHVFDFSDTLSRVSSANLYYCSAAVALSLFFRLFMTPLVWSKILSYSGKEIKYSDLFVINAVSLPLKFFVPFKLSEFTRASGLKLFSKEDFSVALGSAVYLRVVAVAAILIFVCIGAAIDAKLLPMLLAFAALAVAVVAYGRLGGTGVKLPEYLMNFMHCFREIRGKKLLNILYMGIFLQIGEILCAYLIFLSIGVAPEIHKLIFPVAVIMLVSSLPVSIQGLGVRESVSIMSFAAISKDLAFSFGLMQSVVYHIVPAIAGSVIWLFDFTTRNFAKAIGREVYES